MRFLVTHHSNQEKVKQLLDELKVTDVHVIAAGARDNALSTEVRHLLEQHRGAYAAAVEIVKSYKKLVEPYVKFSCEPKKFRLEDRVLREWLRPTEQDHSECPSPRTAMEDAARGAFKLVLHPDSLNRADEIPSHRWEFVRRSANLLARLSNGDRLGPQQEWEAKHGVHCAPNGRVKYSYHVWCGNERKRGTAERHLKQGDNTTAESAVRIYFDTILFDHHGTYVVVFYVGPHPSDGEHQSSMTIA